MCGKACAETAWTSPMRSRSMFTMLRASSVDLGCQFDSAGGGAHGAPHGSCGQGAWTGRAWSYRPSAADTQANAELTSTYHWAGPPRTIAACKDSLA
eukprot:7381197-Prymnesium_polylepis.1